MRLLTKKLRKELKRPMGRLLKKIGRVGKARVIAIGDVAAYNLLQNGITPQMIVYDRKVKRRPAAKKITAFLDNLGWKTFRIANKRGTISEEAWIAIEEGLRKRSKIIVNGEEDLLVLPAVLLAKKGYLVFYGQPNKGIVLIRVSAKKKKEVKKLVDQMEVVL